jgi:hypothetical protein
LVDPVSPAKPSPTKLRDLKDPFAGPN